MANHTLITLRPPGNVERTINDLRNDLFASTGATGTQALPPWFILCYVREEPPEAIADSLPQTLMAPLRPGALRVLRDSVVVATPLDDEWRRWISAGAPAPVPPGMAEAGEGFFVGAADLARGVGGVRDGDPPAGGANESDDSKPSAGAANGGGVRKPPVPGRLSTLLLQCAVIRIPGPGVVVTPGEWWVNVEWEVRWSRRIKLRG